MCCADDDGLDDDDYTARLKIITTLQLICNDFFIV